MITILDNTFTIDECQQLIESYNQNVNFCHVHNGTFPVNIEKCQYNIQLLYSLIEKLLFKVYSINKDIELDWIEIVKWPPGTFQPFHYDTASPETVFTSITYLNDDFLGGNTYMEDGTLIGIKVSRTVMFDGMKYLHGVKPVGGGTRYTIAAWYKKKLTICKN